MASAVLKITALCTLCLALLAPIQGTQGKSLDEGVFSPRTLGLLGGLWGGAAGGNSALVQLANIQSKMDQVLTKIQTLPAPAAGAGK